MKKILKVFVIVLIIALVAIQFINRPEKTSSLEITSDDITKQLNVPSNVQGILKRSCYDCHSNQTVWPWYSNVAPVSWLVAKDVREGRKEMNLSEWGKLSDNKKSKLLSDICEQITDGEMPLKPYLIMHSDAKLSEEDKKTLCEWAESEMNKLESGE
ncbi:MAG: heme-binding domain-containing protein [Ignavibacteria bacterium]|nr:heme-binding domain-containing protein [Ignavibacteria bacterium]